MLYTQTEIEAVKRGVDLVALIRSSGVELKGKGKDFGGARGQVFTFNILTPLQSPFPGTKLFP